MKIKQPLEMETFNDGICSIYDVDEEGAPILKVENIRFSDRVCGVKRYYAAAAAQKEISRIIRIPQIRTITDSDFVVIDKMKYKIEQLQQIKDTNPPVSDLTLRFLTMFTGGEQP